MQLVINQLIVNYQDRANPALQIKSLEINSGTHLAIMGASGSGKSTFANLISGMENTYDGEILWNERSLNRMSESERDRWRSEYVGLIMQDFHLYPNMSVLENILLPKRFKYWRLPKALIEHAKTLLEKVGIPKQYFNKNTQLLSRGEKQRVVIARALLGSPQIIVADEPTASLDRENSQLISHLILQLAQSQNSTLIVVTHDEEFAEKMHRKIVIKQGEILSDQNA